MFALSVLSSQNLNSLVAIWLVVILGLAAVYDIYQRRIPNILVFVGLVVLVGLQAWLQALEPVSLLIGLMVGLTAWQLKLIGGGDSKLIIFASAAVAPAVLPSLYLCITIAGLFQAYWWILCKKKSDLPYAIAIFVGTLAFLTWNIF